MKISISYPPIESEKGTPLLAQNRQFQYFHSPTYIYPMVPAYAASLLKENGYEVFWDDGIAEELKYEDWKKRIIAEKPDIVAIETKTPVIKRHWKIINELKVESPKSKVVLMGDHVTALPLESMQKCQVDYVITGGDYDFLLAEIVNYIEGTNDELPKGVWYRQNKKIKNTGVFELNNDLNSLPFIDRDLTKWYLYGERLYKREPFTYTMVGRDCPYGKCTFCSWTTLYNNFRTRSPESLLDEIGILIKKYKIREIFDDTGTFPSGIWLKRFCEGMIERGYNKKIIVDCNFRFDYLTKKRAKIMKRAGFRLMKLGLESANQKTLDKLRKNNTVDQIKEGCKIAKDAGLDVHLTIMVGYPWETKDDALRTLKLANDLMKSGLADMLQSTIIIPYPGTPLYQKAVKNEWFLVKLGEYEKFDMTSPVLKTVDMSPDEVMSISKRIYKSFLNPKFIFGHLKKLKSYEDFKYLLRGIRPVIGHLRDFSRKTKK
jgi:radical SAM superfamily enzyme YgiQ (UPF0313 family)